MRDVKPGSIDGRPIDGGTGPYCEGWGGIDGGSEI